MDLPESSKHPILLDKTHYLTTLILRDCHARVMHKATLTELRSRFWVVKAEIIYRYIISGEGKTVCAGADT